MLRRHLHSCVPRGCPVASPLLILTRYRTDVTVTAVPAADAGIDGDDGDGGGGKDSGNRNQRGGRRDPSPSRVLKRLAEKRKKTGDPARRSRKAASTGGSDGDHLIVSGSNDDDSAATAATARQRQARIAKADEKAVQAAHLSMGVISRFLTPPPAATTAAAAHGGAWRRLSPSSASAGDDASGAASNPVVSAYTALFQDSFINPFNGRLMEVHKPLARAFFRLGFRRDTANPLHLKWSPDLFFHSFRDTMAVLQARQQRQQKRQKQQRQQEQEAEVPTEAVMDAMLKPFLAPPSSSSSSLRSARRAERRAPSWRDELVALMRQPDVLTAVPEGIARRYVELSNAFLPPKLDSTPEADTGTVLTPDQQNVVELAVRGHHLFIGGSAGTGKTVLLKAIHRRLAALHVRVAMTATTGVAAVQLGGCTFHHAFHAPVVGEDPLVVALAGAGPAAATHLRASQRRWDANALRAVDVVIIDEVSLLDAPLMDAFDLEARLARMDYAPFGGIQVIMCGDFLQLSIGARDSRPVYLSSAFRHFVQLRLVTPMRHAPDDPLLRLLNELRHGRFDTALFRELNRPVPTDAAELTYIFPRRLEAKRLNEERLQELATPEMLFTPTRGVLQLSGTFTPSAHLARDTDEPFPPREVIVAMLQEEIERHSPSAGRVADLDCVVMPARTPLPSLLVRVRFRDRKSAIPAAALPRPVLDDPTRPPLASLAAPPSAVAGGGSVGDAQFMSQVEWEAAAAALASRLGATLTHLYEQEPAHLIPLSVSMALADMTSMDVAETLSPLRLKLGCRVMVTRNLSRTVSNGSVGVVQAFTPPDPSLFPRRHFMNMRKMMASGDGDAFEALPVVRLLSGEVVQIPPVSTVMGGTAESYYYSHAVRSLPLQLGYGFTVHKVQGLTLQGTVVLDCRHFFDCPHLIYVACSRVRSMDQLIVHNIQPSMVIVKRSALEFSEKLQPASDSAVLSVSRDLPRGAWTRRMTQRVYDPSQ